MINGVFSAEDDVNSAFTVPLPPAVGSIHATPAE